MKYSSTTRLINVIVCALLCAGFGYLAVYFGILITPYIWVGRGPIDLPTMGLALPLMLGAFGFAGLVISLYGLVNSVLSIVKEKDDGLVVRSFGAYIGVGYLLAIFCLFNAVWLYRLTSTNIGYDEYPFVITVFAVLFVVILVVANIPVLKLFGEHEELNKIMKIMDGTLAASTLSVGALFGVSFLTFNASAPLANKDIVLRHMGIAALILLLAGVLATLAFFGYSKAAKTNTIQKKNGLLFELSLASVGAAVIYAGVAEYLTQSGKNPANVSFVYKSTPNTNPNFMEFSVVAFVFGSLIVLAALFLLYNTFIGSKKKAK